MNLARLLSEVKIALQDHLLRDDGPVTDGGGAGCPCTLFFALSRAGTTAGIRAVRGDGFENAWQEGVCAVAEMAETLPPGEPWLRVDAVSDVTAIEWAALQKRVALSKRNYFRYGLSFTEDFSVAVLEQEINAHALLYSSTTGVATPNAANLTAYGRQRFGIALEWPAEPDRRLWLFRTRAVFADASGVYRITPEGRNSGYRQIDWGRDAVETAIASATDYLARQVTASGRYHYGWFPCTDRPIPTYNALRHASSTYALLEGWEVTQESGHREAAERALKDLTENWIRPVALPDGRQAAFLVDLGGEIKLGGNAVCLLALVKYTELTGDRRHLPLMEQIALGILHMQDAATGRFVHVLNYPGLTVKEQSRIIYYDGEAAFGLMRLYGLTGDPRWLAAVERAFDYFIRAEHWRAHDHWLGYCVNELTLHRPDERYYRFGLDNVRGHLDFVLQRVTTFPTLLEMMMAAQQMISRISADPAYAHLLRDFDLRKFGRALEYRARYLLNGFFWPELAMFFPNPARIVGSFFIRHHGFRVRIDDVEHYLSGYVAYRKHLLKRGPEQPQRAAALERRPEPGVIGLLMYPDSPRGFREARLLAWKAAARGLRLFYMSYRDSVPVDGKVRGYLFEAGAWKETVLGVPAIIDNAPPRNPREAEWARQLGKVAFMTCEKLGGKRQTLGLLAEHPRTRDWLIPSAELTMEALDRALDEAEAVILKPFRANRGRGVGLLRRQADGRVAVSTNDASRTFDAAELAAFVAERSGGNWMLQKYVASVDAEGLAFDIRVPVFRGAGGEWKIARSYVRQGAGGVTSNLATGGSVHDVAPFLSALYPPEAVADIVRGLETAALDIVAVIQESYPFVVDAVGCDFGVADGRIYLFEINSYPGIKGCLEEATDIKVEYYVTLNEARTAAAASLPAGNTPAWLERLAAEGAPVSGPAGVEAATGANRRLLREVMARGENNYSDSPFLRRRMGNPAYALIADEARRRGYATKMVSNTHVEVRDRERLLAVFSPNTPNLPMAVARVTKNRERTRRFLRAGGVPVPEGGSFVDYEAALAHFRSRNRPQVVKPLLGSGGKGVSTDIRDEAAFRRAWQLVGNTGKGGVVEDFAVGDELRLIVLGGETVGAVCCVPAHVIGDGEHTIRQLADEKSLSRQRNPLMRAYPIQQFDYLEQVLRRSLDDVPQPGEYVRLSSVSDIAQGGEVVSLVDVLHPSFFELGRRAFEAVPGATQMGLDVVARDFGADAFADNAVIVAADSDPAIGTPRFAAYGPPVGDIATKLLDFVERQAREKDECRQRDPVPRLAPAAVYAPFCGGASFPRAYGTHLRLLRQAAHARGMRVASWSAELTVVSRGDRRHLFCFGMSDGTLQASRRASNDKDWAKKLLARAGVNTPRGGAFAPDACAAAWTFATELGLPVVVKPLAGSGGKGVSTGIRSRKRFEEAWKLAGASKMPQIIVETYYEGRDYRLFVVGRRLVAAAQRLPAHVVGDGMHTIAELVERKNVVRRGNPYHGAKSIVLTPAILRNLAEMRLSPSSVPEAGRHVQFHAVANIGSGGESVDVTGQVHPDWAAIAVAAREAVFDPPHAGLDLIAEDISLPPHAQRWAVIEVNTNADFGVNHFPMHGAGRDVAGALLDELFGDHEDHQRAEAEAARTIRIAPEGRVVGSSALVFPADAAADGADADAPAWAAVHARIFGDVQKIGFRQWTWKAAHLRALSGWVRNLPDGSVEAVFGGRPEAVEDMLAQCRTGPDRARVDDVRAEPWRETVSDGFDIR